MAIFSALFGGLAAGLTAGAVGTTGAAAAAAGASTAAVAAATVGTIAGAIAPAAIGLGTSLGLKPKGQLPPLRPKPPADPAIAAGIADSEHRRRRAALLQRGRSSTVTGAGSGLLSGGSLGSVSLGG